MRPLTQAVVGFILVAAFGWVAASRADQVGDEAAIKQLGIKWREAWNKKDANAMTDLLAEEVDFVTVLGPNGWLKGRSPFKAAHARMFTAGDKVRHVQHGSPRSGIFTWVVQKRDGHWLIIASQNTESMPVLPGQ